MERRRMAPKKAVNLANLEALGAKRLAEILIELGTQEAAIKRRLRLELSAEVGAEAVAADIGKRLTTLRQARSILDWQKRRAFVKDLDLQRQLIVEKVANFRPDLALELLWRFMGLAEPVLNRVDDSRGDVGDVFRQACQDLGAIAAKAAPDSSSFIFGCNDIRSSFLFLVEKYRIVLLMRVFWTPRIGMVYQRHTVF